MEFWQTNSGDSFQQRYLPQNDTNYLDYIKLACVSVFPDSDEAKTNLR